MGATYNPTHAYTTTASDTPQAERTASPADHSPSPTHA
jgi:hypothetical protein